MNRLTSRRLSASQGSPRANEALSTRLLSCAVGAPASLVGSLRDRLPHRRGAATLLLMSGCDETICRPLAAVLTSSGVPPTRRALVRRRSSSHRQSRRDHARRRRQSTASCTCVQRVRSIFRPVPHRRRRLRRRCLTPPPPMMRPSSSTMDRTGRALTASLPNRFKRGSRVCRPHDHDPNRQGVQLQRMRLPCPSNRPHRAAASPSPGASPSQSTTASGAAAMFGLAEYRAPRRAARRLHGVIGQ